MGKLTIAALSPGMVLVADVTDANGRKLLSAGDALTERSIRVLKIWGVPDADIEGVDSGQTENLLLADVSPRVAAAIVASIEKRFVLNDTAHSVVQAFMHAGTQRLAKCVASEADITKILPRIKKGPLPESIPAPVSVRNITQGDMKLGTLPSVFHRLVEVVNDSRSSATDVAEVISHDTDLTARLLRLVNSPFYGLRSRIDTISRAVTIIGSNQLVSLAMGVSILNFFKGIPEEYISMRDFWEHSVATGVAARLLASHLRTPNTERFFVAGLLHDIGRLVIFKMLPDHSAYLLSRARHENVCVHMLEKEVLGFTHDRLAGLLLKEWRCPVSLEKNVRYHHLPSMASNSFEASVLHVADVLAHALHFGTSGSWLVPPLDLSAWKNLALPVNIIFQAAEQMEYQVAEIVRLMRIDE